MPKNPRDPDGTRRPPSREAVETDENEEFWSRPRKTRREDRRRSSRRRRDKSEQADLSDQPAVAEPPDVAPPPAPRAEPRLPQVPPLNPPAAPRSPAAAPSTSNRPPGASRRTLAPPVPPRQTPPRQAPVGPTTSPQIASGRPGRQAVGEPRTRPPRSTGELPTLDARLEGLASRGRQDLAPPRPPELAEPPPTELTTKLPAGPPTFHDVYDEDVYDDDEEEGGESPGSGCRRPALVVVSIALVLVAILLTGVLWVRQQIDPSGPPGDPVTVEIEEGFSTGEIGQTLKDADVIANSFIWTWYVRVKGGGNIQAGSYELRQNMSMGDALGVLTDGPLPPRSDQVTIPEGLTLEQTIARATSEEDGIAGFSADALRQALTDGSIRSRFLPDDQSNPEGTVFPDTYELGDEDTEATLAQRMVAQMDGVLEELEIESRAATVNRTPYEILIIASLIEKEARHDDDRPKVARVIYNRLAQERALQIDATSCYEKAENPCALTDADLNRDSPYNTRNRAGLTPTPIASPGRASIEAALNPADGDWIFYVLDPDVDPEGNRHLFTADEDEFRAAKQRCQEAGFGCG